METRRVRQSSSTGPCHPWQRQMSLVPLPAAAFARTATAVTTAVHSPSARRIHHRWLFHRLRVHRHLLHHRRLFCSQPTAIEFFLHKTNLVLFPSPSLSHTHTHLLTFSFSPSRTYTYTHTQTNAHVPQQRICRHSRDNIHARTHTVTRPFLSTVHVYSMVFF